MFAGHLGAALVIGRAERRVNVGVFIGAAGVFGNCPAMVAVGEGVVGTADEAGDGASGAELKG